jgi:tRNA(adenine34) deaminase
MLNDEKMMRRCLSLGREALRNGDFPVGSVIVIGGVIVAEGIESVKLKNDPTAHAEIEAIRQACAKPATLDLSAATLYSNIEPCWMCAYPILRTKIRRVVFGLGNEKVGWFSANFAELCVEKIKFTTGVLENECRKLSDEFIK